MIEQDKNKPMFPISVVSDILQVHQRTLRIYDEEGLLILTRTPKNRRMYSQKDIEKGGLIQYMTRALGLNLNGIKIILHLLEGIPKDKIFHELDSIAIFSGISSKEQAENRIKLSTRGRKKTPITH